MPDVTSVLIGSSDESSALIGQNVFPVIIGSMLASAGGTFFTHKLWITCALTVIFPVVSVGRYIL